MPIYEYECSQCHQVSDALQKVNDPPPETCPHCGARSTLSRVVSRTSFVLKGGGWYADLYGSSKAPGAGADKGGSSSGESSKSETKSEKKSESKSSGDKPSSKSKKAKSGAA